MRLLYLIFSFLPFLHCFVISEEKDVFCVDGRIAPSVFIIGCQKCGTTSLVADMLRQLPISSGVTLDGEPKKLWKEKHFFDNGQCRIFPNGPACFNDTFINQNDPGYPIQGIDNARKHYFSHYPECTSTDLFEKGINNVLSIDATPRYMRVPMVPIRIQTLYQTLYIKLKFIIILRDPQSRAYSWFRFFALNAVEGKKWARDQLDSKYWFHHNNYQTFEKWVEYQIEIKLKCQNELNISNNKLWPLCDSETGLFGGLYESQIRHWLTSGHGMKANQFILIPLECYTKYPFDMMEYIAKILNIQLGVTFSSIYRKKSDSNNKLSIQENSKRLKQLSNNNKKVSVWANKHSEQTIPLSTVEILNDFFSEEIHKMKQLLIEYPDLNCADCDLDYFYKQS